MTERSTFVTKIPQAAIADLVEAVPVPRLPLKIVG
jgi:hypothetical protein